MKQILLLALTAFVTAFSFAQQRYGTLDTSFGTDGKVVSNNFGRCNAVVLQPDGKIVAAGLGVFNEDTGFVLARYLPDGTLDTSFGNGGRTATGFDESGAPYLHAVALLPDRRIVAAGITNNNAILTCYLPNGTPDSSFGVNGIVSLRIYNQNSFYDLAIQPDGKIVAIGIIADYTDPDNGVFYNLVARYMPNGTPDLSFGSEGRVLASGDVALASHVVLQPDGKIVTAGFGGIDYNLYYVARYNVDGTPDLSFGNGGTTLISYPRKEVGGVNDVGLQKDGKIILGGNYGSFGSRYETLLLLRLNPNGTQDTAFGEGGRAKAVFGEQQAADGAALVILPDDRIVLGGEVFPDDYEFAYENFALAGFTPDGKIDSSFGENGIVQTEFTRLSGINALALQRDGKIVAAGTTAGGQTNYDGSFALARYNGEGTKQSLMAKLKRFLHNHGITWNGSNNNVSYYSIEHSTGAGFREVSRVQANSVQQSYNYIIPSSSSGNITTSTDYYRVRAVGTNGQSNFSNVVAVSDEANDANAITLYPNPAINQLTIRGLDASMHYKVTVTDLSGTVYLTSTIKQQSTTTLNVSRLRRGNYVLNISNASVNTTLKLVKE